MSTTLLGNINNDYYINQNTLNGTPNLIHVLVEDEEDVAFWEDLLEYSAPEKDYDITPYHHRILLKNN